MPSIIRDNLYLVFYWFCMVWAEKMDYIYLKIKVKKDDRVCEEIRDNGMFFENIADALNIARSQIEEIDDPEEPLTQIKNNSKIIDIIKKEFRLSLGECWEYHKSTMRKADGTLKKSELEDFLYNCEFNKWEDIGWHTGYLRGLDWCADKILESETLSAKTITKIKNTQKLLKKKLAGD